MKDPKLNHHSTLVHTAYGQTRLFMLYHSGACTQLKDYLYEQDLDSWDICLEDLCIAKHVTDVVKFVQENFVGHHESFEKFEIVQLEDFK